APDTVLASTSPVTPSSVIPPETLLTEVREPMPDTTAAALTTPTCAAVFRGTLTVTVAACRCGRSHFSRPSQLRFSCATVRTPFSNVTWSGSPSRWDTSSEDVPSAASTADEPDPQPGDPVELHLRRSIDPPLRRRAHRHSTRPSRKPGQYT